MSVMRCLMDFEAGIFSTLGTTCAKTQRGGDLPQVIAD